jgi:hypothetical protein
LFKVIQQRSEKNGIDAGWHGMPLLRILPIKK